MLLRISETYFINTRHIVEVRLVDELPGYWRIEAVPCWSGGGDVDPDEERDVVLFKLTGDETCVFCPKSKTRSFMQAIANAESDLESSVAKVNTESLE